MRKAGRQRFEPCRKLRLALSKKWTPTPLLPLLPSVQILFDSFCGACVRGRGLTDFGPKGADEESGAPEVRAVSEATVGAEQEMDANPFVTFAAFCSNTL